MRTSVGRFVAETGEGSRDSRGFSVETSRIPEARIDGTVRARLGAMVAYRGDLTYEHAGIRQTGGGPGREGDRVMTGLRVSTTTPSFPRQASTIVTG